MQEVFLLVLYFVILKTNMFKFQFALEWVFE